MIQPIQSLYTITLADVLYGMYDGDPIKDSYTKVIKQCAPKVFNFNYPFYSEDAKIVFQELYCTRFFKLEIGQETLNAHRLSFLGLMSEKYENYKQLFQSVSNLPYTLVNYIISESTTENNNSNGSSNTDTTQNTQSIQSDNPQITFSDNDYASAMDRGEAKVESSSTDTLIRNIDRKISRYGVTNADTAKLARNTVEGMFSVNNIILKDCRKLFMEVW